MTRFQTFTRISVVATLVLIGLGSVVRTSGSGLGCPDWPLCHGSPIPPLERTALIEWSHRTVASFTGLLIVVQAVWAFVSFRRDRVLNRVTLATVPLLALQALLGREAVVRELPPAVVAVHMVSALLLLGLLTLVAVLATTGAERVPDGRASHATFRRAARLVVLAVAAVMVVGAYNLASGAGFACPSWPGCPDAPWPFLTGGWLTHVHWLHRLTVAGALLAAIFLVRSARGLRAASPALTAGASMLLVLYVVQGMVGAVTIWTDFAAAARTSHLAVGAAVWALAVALAAASHVTAPRAATVDAPAPARH